MFAPSPEKGDAVGLFVEGEAAGRPSAPTRSNDGIARAVREFRIEQLRVGEVLAGGDQLISLGELMTSGTRADPGMGSSLCITAAGRISLASVRGGEGI